MDERTAVDDNVDNDSACPVVCIDHVYRNQRGQRQPRSSATRLLCNKRNTTLEYEHSIPRKY